MPASRKSPAASDCPWLALATGAPVDLDDYPISMLMRVAARAQQEVTRVYARAHGLSPSEWRLLARLAESAPMQLSALCKASAFDKAQAGRVLKGLEERKLVTLQTDAAHRRRVVVDITRKGRALAARLFPIAEAAQRELLAPLTAQERQAMYAGLKKLLAT